jgi:hypothetical protein
MAKRFVVLTALLMLGFFIAGCAEGDKSGTVTNPNPNVFAPMGSISGVVMNFCNPPQPVKGAIVSVAYNGAVHKVTTGQDGGFSFKDVPAIVYVPGNTDVLGLVNGTTSDVSSDSIISDLSINPLYEVVCDLSNIKDSTGAFVYGYKNSAGTQVNGYTTIQPAVVYATDLGDGTNVNQTSAGTFSESGSGSSTPVTGLATNVFFAVGKPNASISGYVFDTTSGNDVKVTDVLTGLTQTTVVDGTTVQLWKTFDVDEVGADYKTLIDTTTTTAGKYTFNNVIPISSTYDNGKYKVKVVKAMYDGDRDNIWVDCGEAVIEENFAIAYNPDSSYFDTTNPYVKEVLATGGLTKAEGGSLFADNIGTVPIVSFTVDFNKAMNQLHTTSLKYGTNLTSSIAVTFTSAGPNNHTVTDTLDIIKTWTVAWASSGLSLAYTPTYYTPAELRVLAEVPVGWSSPTVTYKGSYKLALNNGLYNNQTTGNPFIMDLADNAWVLDGNATPDAVITKQMDALFKNYDTVSSYRWYYIWLRVGDADSSLPIPVSSGS